MSNMDIRLLFCCATAPIKAGIVHPNEHTSVIYGVFDRAEVEEEMGWPAKTGDSQYASNLTGLHRESSGPGRGFANDPMMKVFRKKILIVQRRGDRHLMPLSNTEKDDILVELNDELELDLSDEEYTRLRRLSQADLFLLTSLFARAARKLRQKIKEDTE